MIENVVGKRYAEALAGAISDDARLAGVLRGLREVGEAFQAGSDISRVFSHPTIPLAGKVEVLKDLCSRLNVDAEARNLLLLLVERNKMMFLKNIADFFAVVVDKRLNRIRVHVTAAGPLDAAQKDRIVGSLRQQTGKDVQIEDAVDASLLGGIVLRMGGMVVDASVKNRLAAMKRCIEKEEVA